MTTPLGGIGQGMTFGYGPQTMHGDLWVTESGNFNLLGSDNIFLYCLDGDGQMRFLSGFSSFGNWKVPNLPDEEYGEGTSALPQQLLNAHVTLEPMNNYFYNGTRTDTIFAIRQDIRNAAEWVGDNEGRFTVGDGSDTSDAESLFSSKLFSLLVVLIVPCLLW